MLIIWTDRSVQKLTYIVIYARHMNYRVITIFITDIYMLALAIIFGHLLVNS